MNASTQNMRSDTISAAPSPLKPASPIEAACSDLHDKLTNQSDTIDRLVKALGPVITPVPAPPISEEKSTPNYASQLRVTIEAASHRIDDSIEKLRNLISSLEV